MCKAGQFHAMRLFRRIQNSDNPPDPATVTQSTVQARSLQTYGDALNFIQPDAP
jgi:hypothetical protein